MCRVLVFVWYNLSWGFFCRWLVVCSRVFIGSLMFIRCRVMFCLCNWVFRWLKVFVLVVLI